MSYYPDYEPESLFVADVDGEVVGALLGAVNTQRFEQIYRHRIRRLLFWRGLTGAYGRPGWLPAIWRTEWAEREVKAPEVDRNIYPAHLHISILPAFRRQGLGKALMEKYETYLRSRSVSGYHLYASSYHPLGIAFYHKIGLELLGQFEWPLQTGFEWVKVTESIFGRRI